MKTIAILNCYFGKWSHWADLFLASCRKNVNVDFFLITNCAPPQIKSDPNIHVIELDLAQVVALASEKFGFQVICTTSTKWIDFRPAWGVIFEDQVKDYDFWGYCDLDIVFGDIRKFLTDEVLEDYDLISARPEFLTGHFALYRNIPEITRLFERSRDYRKVFTTSGGSFNFEECGWGLHPRLIRGASFAELASEAKVDSMMHVIARSPDIRVYLRMICDEHIPAHPLKSGDQVLWENGRLLKMPSASEIMYFHLHFLKYELGFYAPAWKVIPDAFVITRKGIFKLGDHSLRQKLTIAILRKINVVVKLAELLPQAGARLMRLSSFYFRRFLSRLSRNV